MVANFNNLEREQQAGPAQLPALAVAGPADRVSPGSGPQEARPSPFSVCCSRNYEREGNMKTNSDVKAVNPAVVGRRKFLGAVGAGGITLAASSFIGMRSALAQRFVLREENFGRMFPRLDPFFERPSNALNAALVEIGKHGGVMDAKDNLAAGPIALIVDPALNVNNPNNTTHTAGTTFMGQFMDHDMTFDLTSALGDPTDPEDSPNARTPKLDLDSVYAGGPRRSPQLYGPTARGSS